MRRNKGIDIARAIAIMSVLIYHFYVLVDGNRYIDYPIVHGLILVGGEIGVTLFFIISGYGIFWSIKRMEEKDYFDYWKFMKKRCVRILPQYYLSLLVIIFVGSQGFVLSKDGIWHIITHALLIHNFFPSTCGSISTVLWTMGVIFQFYLIAYWLYKAVKGKPVITLLLSIIFTVACKILIFHFVFKQMHIENSYYFIYGRQLFTAIDNFMIGMFLACYEDKIKVKKVFKYLIIIVTVIITCVWCIMPQASYRHSDSLSGYIWSSVLAVLLGIMVWFLGTYEYKKDTKVLKSIMFISKYQYGIYLWHFVVAANLIQNSPAFNKLAQNSFLGLTFILCVICVIVGYISTITLEAPDYAKVFSRK